MSVVRQLYQLQLIDSEWDDKKARLDELLEALGLSDEVKQARQAVIEAEQELQRARSRLKALELELGGVSAKLKANEERLYGGQVRNPKELSGLEEEAKALRRRRGELEDKGLEQMFAIDELAAELAERQARLRQIESTWQEEQAVLQAEKEQLELRLAELAELREEARAHIAAADIALYDNLRARLGGKAVSLLKRGLCQGCGVDLPTEEALAVQRGEGMNFCPICGRLLVAGA